ncbi:discoidin, CUB and LCCL domain-containing protein 2 isoform X3 [Panthera pardus]|uniref:Discoidin, CUB and LCCL domain-containing protein 2 isoform X3 n=1 Tax=Panthera pardus TaxID=9691 RepID=A0A9V1FIW5_PANPR|nr:discoidin, CUB and LCCL domain-containing protein 2 isoform X3 [Panthera pardus]
MGSRAAVRAGRSPPRLRVRAAAAAPARAALPFSRPRPPRPNSSSSSFPMPLFLLLLLILLLLLEDAGAQQGDGCGHTVLGPESGTLMSINYPQTYPNSTVCEWEIRVKMGERVRIKFGDFDIEDSDSCHFNYLRIYNGIGVSRTEIDLITCLDTASSFLEPEFSKYCPAGCLLPFAEISGTIPHGYRDSSPLCMAGVHAGVVSNILGGQISVVISKGIPYYESSLANNVTSVVGHLSTSLFTFKTSGCYGTLGMESGVIADPQITASSVLEWTDHTGRENSWKPEKARLKQPGPPWAAFAADEYQWLQIDLNKEKKITGIVTTGSTMVEHNYYVSAYRILYSDDGQRWTVYREPGVEQDKIFQGNKDYHQDVRNNFLPPIIARFIRVNPTQWQQKIAMKIELLGCQFIPKGRPPKLTQTPPPRNSNDLRNTTTPPKIAKGRAPKFTQPLQPRSSNEFPAQTEQTTATPDIRNTTVTPNVTKDVALAAVLVPVLVMVLSTLILTVVCAWHWRSRKKKTEGTYDLPYWDRAGWWKGMKQFLPAKSVEHEETPVRYSSSEVNHLSPREVTTVLQTDSAEYAQPLVGGIVGTLHQRSTFKPEEGKEASYADLDPYNSPVQEVYHAYAEPLPITGPEYATPIIMDMSGHPTASVGLTSTSTFKAAGNQAPPVVGAYNTLLSRTDSCSSARAQYDTPKGGKPGPSAPDELVYQVPQSTQEGSGAGRDGECDVFKEIL